MKFPPLDQQQQALFEYYCRARAAWIMAVNREDDAETGTAFAAARDACISAGFDPFYYPQSS